MRAVAGHAVTVGACSALAVAACGHSPEPAPSPASMAAHAPSHTATLGESTAAPFPPPPPSGLQILLQSPANNRPTPERVALGRRLFFDQALSRDSSLACASCHQPELAFGDSLRLSPGVEDRTGTRTTPPLVNRGYGARFFWDGRAQALEEAVLLPIENPRELDLAMGSLEARLRSDPHYQVLFARAYPDAAAAERSDRLSAPGETTVREGPSGKLIGTPISRLTIGAALASYVRLIRFGDAPADRFASGDTSALSPTAARGRRLFLGRANCTACHIGPNLTDEAFHVTGVAHASGDPGRAGVTGREEDEGAFKTPTLREVARTAPYMHDGSLATLEEVVRFYGRGGLPHPNLSAEIEALSLTDDEVGDLVAFLESLSGRMEAPGPQGMPR